MTFLPNSRLLSSLVCQMPEDKHTAVKADQSLTWMTNFLTKHSTQFWAAVWRHPSIAKPGMSAASGETGYLDQLHDSHFNQTRLRELHNTLMSLGQHDAQYPLVLQRYNELTEEVARFNEERRRKNNEAAQGVPPAGRHQKQPAARKQKRPRAKKPEKEAGGGGEKREKREKRLPSEPLAHRMMHSNLMPPISVHPGAGMFGSESIPHTRPASAQCDDAFLVHTPRQSHVFAPIIDTTLPTLKRHEAERQQQRAREEASGLVDRRAELVAEGDEASLLQMDIAMRIKQSPAMLDLQKKCRAGISTSVQDETDKCSTVDMTNFRKEKKIPNRKPNRRDAKLERDHKKEQKERASKEETSTVRKDLLEHAKKFKADHENGGAAAVKKMNRSCSPRFPMARARFCRLARFKIFMGNRVSAVGRCCRSTPLARGTGRSGWRSLRRSGSST